MVVFRLVSAGCVGKMTGVGRSGLAAGCVILDRNVFASNENL